MQNVSTSSLVGSANPGKWTRGGSPTRASPPLTRINSPDHEECNGDDNKIDYDDDSDNDGNDDDDNDGDDDDNYNDDKDDDDKNFIQGKEFESSGFSRRLECTAFATLLHRCRHHQHEHRHRYLCHYCHTPTQVSSSSLSST